MTRAAQPEGRCRRRGDDGLTTLEWLLITAAMAGLAALAVVLVQAYVEDTGDGISNPNPRVTTAVHSAFAVETEAKGASAGDFDLWADWERHFSQRCSLIAVLFSDAEVEVVDNHFIRATGGTAFDPAAAALADEQPANARQGPGAMRRGLSHSPARATDRTGPPNDSRAGGRSPDAAQPQDHRVDAGLRLPSR